LAFEHRNFVKEMQTVRNRWAHAATDGIHIDDMYRDLDTLLRFATVIGAGEKVTHELRETKATLLAAMAQSLYEYKNNISSAEPIKKNGVLLELSPTKPELPNEELAMQNAAPAPALTDISASPDARRELQYPRPILDKHGNTTPFPQINEYANFTYLLHHYDIKLYEDNLLYYVSGVEEIMREYFSRNKTHIRNRYYGPYTQRELASFILVLCQNSNWRKLSSASRLVQTWIALETLQFDERAQQPGPADKSDIDLILEEVFPISKSTMPESYLAKINIVRYEGPRLMKTSQVLEILMAHGFKNIKLTVLEHALERHCGKWTGTTDGKERPDKRRIIRKGRLCQGWSEKKQCYNFRKWVMPPMAEISKRSIKT
jgi:hypothetical protein